MRHHHRNTPGGALKTQAEIAELLGVSRVRVYQLEQRALMKIRKGLETDARAKNLTMREYLFGE